MNLIFVTNARFTMASDGKIYGIHTSIHYETFKHYLQVFDKVYVIARLEKVDEVVNNAARVDLEGVEILPLPFYKGMVQFFKNQNKIKTQLRSYLDQYHGAVIARIPGSMGRMVASILHQKKQPFALEIAGDPYDVFAKGSFNHPLRIPLRYLGYYHLKRSIAKASAVLYVTEKALQQRYPAKKGVYTTNASNVILKEEAFVATPKVLVQSDGFVVACIGTLDQMYKSPDIMIDAISILNNKGISVQLHWIGDGSYRKEMENRVKSLNLENKVVFKGIVKPAEKVRVALDAADLFALPSRTEGLPRSLIEAMARGLPCVGTAIGGIPELLPEEVMVRINDAEALADTIEGILTKPEYANALAKRNLEKAEEYQYAILNERRFQFYNTILKLTEDKNEAK